MTALRDLLTELEADRLTGRVTVRSVAGGWLYLHEGRISCAERAGQPTLLVAMAGEGLFTAEEWQVALRLPFGRKWDTLAAGDPVRRSAMASFARRFVAGATSGLVRQERATAVFSPAVTHPFGPLATWTLDELLQDVPVSTVAGPGVALIDRAAFLELLEEVSPHVRRVAAG